MYNTNEKVENTYNLTAIALLLLKKGPNIKLLCMNKST